MDTKKKNHTNEYVQIMIKKKYISNYKSRQKK